MFFIWICNITYYVCFDSNFSLKQGDGNWKSKSMIDQIWSNAPNKLVHNDIILNVEIRDYVTLYVIMTVKKERYETRYKYEGDKRNIGITKYMQEFDELPRGVVFRFYEPDNEIFTPSKRITDSKDQHAPPYQVKLSLPIAQDGRPIYRPNSKRI